MKKEQQITWQGDLDASNSGNVNNETPKRREERKEQKKNALSFTNTNILLLLSFRSQIDCVILCVNDFNVSFM